MGRMGQQLIKSIKADRATKLVGLTENILIKNKRNYWNNLEKLKTKNQIQVLRNFFKKQRISGRVRLKNVR